MVGGPAGVDEFPVGGVAVLSELLVASHAVAGGGAQVGVVDPPEFGVAEGVADVLPVVSCRVFADDSCVASACHDVPVPGSIAVTVAFGNKTLAGYVGGGLRRSLSHTRRHQESFTGIW